MYNTLSLLEKPNQMIHAQESTQKWWGEMQKLPHAHGFAPDLLWNS
jgi:hypothetical protein